MLAACCAALAVPFVARAQPVPGDVFREYLWTNGKGDAGGSLRVGGKLGYPGDTIELPHRLDLREAIRAEVVIEKLLCHDGTRGLAISVNGNPWIEVPEAPGIPAPQWEYQHHIYPVVSVPLGQLRSGDGNEFRLRVSDEHPRKWPQNLIYGVHFRVYYNAAKKAHPVGEIVSPQPGEALPARAELAVSATSPDAPLSRVDFLACHEDVNLEGDGQYTQWHYHYVRGQLSGQIASVSAAPWRSTWDTTWVPDQPKPFQLAARITDQTGLTYFTKTVDGLTLSRPDVQVELCKPYDIPKRWVTRRGDHSEKFRVTGDLGKAIAAQLVWVSWSPGYMNGILINGRKVFDHEGPHYAHYVHHVPLDDLSTLQSGENVLTTGLTPKRDGKMVHGMEVNWPGIMVLIQYRK